MPPEKQSKRQVNDSGEMLGPDSKPSGRNTPQTEQIVEVKGPGGCRAAAGETLSAPQEKKDGHSTAEEAPAERQKQGHSAGSSNNGGKELSKDSSASRLRHEMAQEMNESKDSGSAAGMGVSVEKTCDHQARLNRRTGPKLKREDLLKDRYSQLGTPLLEVRQRVIQECQRIFPPDSGDFEELESEDSDSESE
ncbi:hypothetical protein KC343_g389 [Hortaea werneckii]|nr:hypothetical protein KC352_g3183 [Hortaea werneckii]KAI7572780.1 hypothetical protein KC317_g456 [Hortaea werneckii]KAI7628019.1 hypothetical protein KC346_g439 [Hortaea werneckii]KAI7637988.1 hypothetical protein KC343_g389 [Hortaea werneckii]KAI7683614.1 hypothetical protein KC319_g378 [Hortaea werneckii]